MMKRPLHAWGQAFLEEHPTTIRCNLNAISKEESIQELSGRTGEWKKPVFHMPSVFVDRDYK